MQRWFTSQGRRFAIREHGQALVLFAAGLAAFCGLVGMSVDVGQVVYAKTDLQKAADAAALAGSQDLNGTTSGAVAAIADADSYVVKNGHADAPCRPNCATVVAPYDTITVNLTKHVDYTFLKVIGLDGATPAAAAAVKVIIATGFAFNNPAVFPYTIWGGNPNYGSCHVPFGLCQGATKTYSSNQWVNRNVSNNNSNWNMAGGSNNFKGYFNTSDQQQTVYQSDLNNQYSFGGNATGQQPLDALHQHWVTHTPIVIPVIAKGNCTGNCGTLNFTIVAWVALRLDQDPTANGSGDLTGTIVNYTAPGGISGGYVAGGGSAQVMSATMFQ